MTMKVTMTRHDENPHDAQYNEFVTADSPSVCFVVVTAHSNSI